MELEQIHPFPDLDSINLGAGGVVWEKIWVEAFSLRRQFGSDLKLQEDGSNLCRACSSAAQIQHVESTVPAQTIKSLQ